MTSDLTPPASPARAWMEITRISNAPTVVSNVAAGLCLATGGIDVASLCILSMGILCIYAAGMILNDLCDEAVDRVERPERPIPSGRITRSAAQSATAILFTCGLAFLTPRMEAVMAGIALIGLIFVYNWRHKNNSVAPLVMGACRAMIYVVVAFSVADVIPPQTRTMGGLLMIYIAAVTWLARDEANADAAPSKVAAVGVMWIPVLLVGISVRHPVALCVNVAFLLWVTLSLRNVLLRPGAPIGPTIGKLLAGMCLFDGIIVAAVAPAWTPLPLLAMGAVTGLHRRIKGT